MSGSELVLCSGRGCPSGRALRRVAGMPPCDPAGLVPVCCPLSRAGCFLHSAAHLFFTALSVLQASDVHDEDPARPWLAATPPHELCQQGLATVLMHWWGSAV